MLRGVDLISPAYREEQIRLHAQPRGYGQRGRKWADVALALIYEYKIASVLDYGCGQGSLKTELKEKLGPKSIVRIDEYDPAIKGKDHTPLFADMVVCTDVLEHVEPEKLDNVLWHIKMLMRHVALVVVSTCETAKTLSDGRQAHLIVEPSDWWISRVQAAGFAVLPPPELARRRPDKEWCAVLTHGKDATPSL